MKPHRFAMLVALPLCAALLLSGCGSGQGSAPTGAQGGASSKPAPLTPVTLRMHWVASSNHAGFVVAMDRGWYRERGLDVKILDGKGSVSTVQTVGAGQDTFGYASLATLIIGRKELPVKAIATIYQKSDIGIMVPVDSPIQTLKDLNGRNLIYTAGSFEVPFLPMLFVRNGVDAASVKMISIAGDAKYTQYIVGQGDAVAASAPALVTRAKDQRPSRTFLFSDSGVPQAGTGLLTTDKVIAEQPQMVRGFVEASLMGVEWATKNPREAIALLKRYYPDILEETLAAQLVEFENYLDTDRTKDKPLGVFLDEEWRPIVDTMVQAELIPEARPLSDYYTNEFLPKQ
jgi:NitT/TauT family transport system substrate-binding protein